MKTVGAFEAKTHLSQLLDEVEDGGSITITRRGRPVAVLTPPNGTRKRDVAEVIAAINEFRERAQLTTGGMTIREMVDEGRRF